MIKDLMNGRKVEWNDKELELKWVRDELPEIEMHVAGYGPKALAVAGRVGDGVIIQLADPQIIQWIMATARKAAEEAGRDPAALKCIVCAPSHISDDLAEAREQVRWFPAMVSNHVMDLIERYGFDSDEIPTALTDFVKARKFYDYKDHSRVGAKHGEFVTDEICDRFCVLGNTEQATEKLRELESIGVDQFDIYLMTEGPGRDPRRLWQGRHPAVQRGCGVRAPALVAAAALVVLLAAACGSSNKSSSSTTTAASGASCCEQGPAQPRQEGPADRRDGQPRLPALVRGGTPKGSTWQFNDPKTGKGYESAVAYAVAKKLGFQRSAVKWVVVPFEQLFKPGKAAYDFDVNQVSVTPQRKQSVTFSDSYYNANQSLVANKGTPIT